MVIWHMAFILGSAPSRLSARKPDSETAGLMPMKQYSIGGVDNIILLGNLRSRPHQGTACA